MGHLIVVPLGAAKKVPAKQIKLNEAVSDANDLAMNNGVPDETRAVFQGEGKLSGSVGMDVIDDFIIDGFEGTLDDMWLLTNRVLEEISQKRKEKRRDPTAP